MNNDKTKDFNKILDMAKINLTDEEKEQFNLSIKAVQDLYEVAKNIDKNL